MSLTWHFTLAILYLSVAKEVIVLVWNQVFAGSIPAAQTNSGGVMSTVTNIADAPKSKQERLDIYCQALADGKKREDAYIAAGYSAATAKGNAQKYHKTNHEYITSFFADHIGTHAPAALKVLLEIMNSQHEKGGIRLKAAQDLLDRAGYSAKSKIEISTKEVNEMSTGELESEIKRLLGEEPKLARLFTGQTDS